MTRYKQTSEGVVPFTAEEEAEWDAKEAALAIEQAALERTKYQRDRAKEYPPIADYIDGIVKGDALQVQTYISACMAVKAKYPKPE